jgi:hypothetical protein
MTNTTSSSSSTTTTTTTPTTTTTLNLSNNLIGGLSKHFFQHSKSPNPNNPSSSESSSKSSKLLAGGKKDRRGKLSLITGLTRQKETASFSQLETVGATNLYTQKPHLDPHSLSEQLDALADRSAIDTVEISKLNQARFQKVADHHHHQQLLQPTKSKKLAFNADSKMNRKKLSSDSANATATATANQASVTSQLSLGPGAAMNSQGAGSGQWKLVQGVITEDGHFTLYTSVSPISSGSNLKKPHLTSLFIGVYNFYRMMQCYTEYICLPTDARISTWSTSPSLAVPIAA